MKSAFTPALRLGLAASLMATALATAFAAGDEPLATPAARTAGAGLSTALAQSVAASRTLMSSGKATNGLQKLGEPALLRAFSDADGSSHVHWQSTVSGVPVWGGDFVMHLDAARRSKGLTAPSTPNLRRGLGLAAAGSDGSLRLAERPAIATLPRLNGERAVALAEAANGCGKCYTEAARTDLWVLMVESEPHLAWRVQLRRLDGSAQSAMPVLFIDAQDGSELLRYDNLQTGSGSSLYSGTVNVTTSQSGGTYYLEDTGRKLGTFDSRSSTSSTYRFTDADDVWNTATQRAGVDAHYGMQKYYDFLLSAYGRNGLDGSGGPGYFTAAANSAVGLISGRVHYGSSYNNAAWTGEYMIYGDGDGSSFTPLVSLDVVGHELTHGLTQFTAGLVYSNESGALNESFSDVFGALAERYVQGESANTWLIGEQIYTPGTAGDALRSMANPHLAANSGFTSDDDPDHYSERYTGSSDNGGVHINSGIPNKAFHLLAVGGSHHLGGSITGIGADAAGRIWFRALTTYLTSSSNFAAARTATINAANDLYGASSTQSTAVAGAWCLVGVGSCGGTPPPTGGELFSNGGFEGSVSPWVTSGTGSLYVANGNYPRSGTGYPYFGAANNVTGQLYQQITIPSTANAQLTFWLNVTSAESSTSTQYDKLSVEVRNTAGTLLTTLATYSNLNKVAAGSYSQKSFSLAAYKGQTVRLQFSTTNDSSAITTFRLDDASLK